MININRVFIATDKEFREHFDLEVMAEQALAIALDEEIFIKESERALQAVLAAAAKGTSGRTGTDEGGNAFVECDGCRGIIATALPDGSVKEKTLTAANVVRLVLCELGGRSFEELITDETADLKPLNELNGGQTDPVKTFNPDSDNCDAPLRNIFYINCRRKNTARRWHRLHPYRTWRRTGASDKGQPIHIGASAHERNAESPRGHTAQKRQ